MVTDEKILKMLKNWAQDRSCLQCMHWKELKEICEKFNVRPPAKVIVNGCEHHDFIPF